MNWGEMRVMIRELVGDPERSNGSANRYSAKQIADATNHAMKLYARKTACTHTVAASLAISAGSVVDTSAIRVLDALEVEWNGNGLDKSYESFERQKDPKYRTGAGTAYSRWFVDTGNKIQLLPAIGTALTPATVKLLYLETPTAVTAATPDNTAIDPRINEADQEHLRLLAGAYLKKLLGDANDTKLADSWVQMFMGLMGGA